MTNFKIYRNRKSNVPYIKLADGMDCTNIRDGTPVVVYCSTKGAKIFVREAHEFYEKFDIEE